MKLHDVIQGSPEWLAQRLNTYNASDAPAMLGCSPYETRSQLIARLATGIVPEVDAATQRRFDDGHRFEELARPLAVEIIGEDLYPVSGSEDFGLDKPLAASLDGSTILDEIVWEHKSLNDELRAVLPETGIGGFEVGARLPKVYRVQMEQQLMVSGAGKDLFTASKWEMRDGKWVCVEARHCWYQSDSALRAEILGGWKQLAEDVKAYVPPSASALEKIVAEPVEALPAPVVRVAGQITLVDNFKAFEERLREFLATKLIREPRTDEDFVNLDSQIKAMKSARESLKAAESQMLAQVQPVDQAKKTKDMLDTLLQQNVSMAEKIMTAEKERRKGEIVAVGVKGLADHIAALNERLGKPYMPAIPADFGGAVKGLKSMSSMEDKVATELARAKIAASEIADRLQKNLDYLRDNAADFKFLFADTATIIQKAPDDLQALVQNRINEHKAAEEKRLEAERERIRKEEQDRLAQQQADAAIAAAAQTKPTGITQAGSPAPAAQVAAQAAVQEQAGTPVVRHVPAASTVSEKPTLKLGEICERLGFTVTAEFLASLGFTATVECNAKLYRESDWSAICEALVQHVYQVADLQPA